MLVEVSCGGREPTHDRVDCSFVRNALFVRCSFVDGYVLFNNGIGSDTMPITIYGIKNCDTMKKARAWLDEHGLDYAFHDYRTAGVHR